MKRFVLRLLVFLSLMFILDRGFGVAMKYLQDHAKGGYVGHHNYILNQSNEDILILGSSRAIHHYNPQIIEDSLGMSCYNCGQDGNGIVLFYGWWQILKNRHLPKMIIYDVNPSFDLLVGENNSKYLGWLRSEFENDDVKHIFEDIDPTEKYKMQSMMYRYNSKFLQNIIDYVHPFFKIKPNGYLPLEGKMDRMKVKVLSDEKKEYILSKQLLKSGTSIGANIAEANCAFSKKDFLAKMYIAFKECAETEYWLELLFDSGIMNEQEFQSMIDDCREIKKLLSSVTKTSKERKPE